MQQEICISEYLRIPVSITNWNDLITQRTAARIAAKPKKLTPKQQEVYEQILSTRDAKSAMGFIRYHHNKAGVDLSEIQKIIEESRKAVYMVRLVKYAGQENLDIKSLEQALLKSKLDAEAILEWSNRVKGCDIQALAKKISKSEKYPVLLSFALEHDLDQPQRFEKVFKSQHRWTDPELYDEFIDKYRDKLDSRRMLDYAIKGGNEAGIDSVRRNFPDLEYTEDDAIMAGYNGGSIVPVLTYYETNGISDEKLAEFFSTMPELHGDYVFSYLHGQVVGHQRDTLVEILSKPAIDPAIAEWVIMANPGLYPRETGKFVIDVCKNRDDLDLGAIKTRLFTMAKPLFDKFAEAFPDVKFEISKIVRPVDAFWVYSSSKDDEVLAEAIRKFEEDDNPQWHEYFDVYPHLPGDVQNIIAERLLTEVAEYHTPDENDPMYGLQYNRGTNLVYGLNEYIKRIKDDEYANDIRLRLINFLIAHPTSRNVNFTQIADLLGDSPTKEMIGAFKDLIKKVPEAARIVDPGLDEELFVKGVESALERPDFENFKKILEIDKKYPGKYIDIISKFILRYIRMSIGNLIVGRPGWSDGSIPDLLEFIHRNKLEDSELMKSMQDEFRDKILRHGIDPGQAKKLKREHPEFDSEEINEAIVIVTEFPDVPGLKEVYKTIEVESEAEYTQFSKDLYQLRKLIKKGMTEVGKLKKANPKLMDRLKPLIKFNQGKPITEEVIHEFENTLEKFDVKITKQPFTLNMQRSLSRRPGYKEVKQIVLKIAAGRKHIDEMKKVKIQDMEKEGVYKLFLLINESFSRTSHPSGKHQLGWVRLDVSLDKKYVLVDEIQSDLEGELANVIKSPQFYNQYIEILPLHDKRMKALRDPELYEKHKDEIEAIKTDTFELLKQAAKALQKITKNFRDIAVQVVTDFANKNKIQKIVWHTYEGGQQLKGNQPPRSLYEKLPKDHYFEVSEDARPFHLPEKFWIREATRRMAYKIASNSTFIPA